MSHRVKKRLADRIANLSGTGRGRQRQRQPFADHRHEPPLVDRQRRLFEARQIGGDTLRIAIGAAAIRAGVVEAVIDGIRSGCRDRDIDIRLIGIMSRTFGEAACLQELEGLLAHRDGITALDLAGDELGFPGSLFLNHFNRARDAGLRITVHAGEAAGPKSIWQAIRELGAERIGHGVKAVEDPALMDFLAEHGIGIESCLTSNIQTSTVPSLAQHPLATFLRHGVLASINTDDPAVQGIEIEHEYRVAAPQAELTPEEIRTAQENGLKLAFLSEQEKQALRAKVQG